MAGGHRHGHTSSRDSPSPPPAKSTRELRSVSPTRNGFDNNSRLFSGMDHVPAVFVAPPASSLDLRLVQLASTLERASDILNSECTRDDDFGRLADRKSVV